jgi:hypothetical protein
MQAIAAAPAAPAVLAQQPARPPSPGQPPKALADTHGDTVADPVPRFFSATQLASLRALSGLLLPAFGGNPGALDAGAPEFLDFLIGESPAERQHLYRTGLDLMNTLAQKQFGKAFASLDAKQMDSIIRPLLVPVPWPYDPPKDPGRHFVTTAHEDIRTATRNSREWAAAAAAAGKRVAGAQLFWNPIDPIYKG